MNRVFKLLSYVPLVLLVLTYGTHAVQSFLGTQDKYDVLNVLNLDVTSTMILLLLTGFHDTLVTVLLVFKQKLLPTLPTIFLYVWTAVWPIIPRYILWEGGKPFEWIEVIMFATFSFLSYYLLKKRENATKSNIKTS